MIDLIKRINQAQIFLIINLKISNFYLFLEMILYRFIDERLLIYFIDTYRITIKYCINLKNNYNKENELQVCEI